MPSLSIFLFSKREYSNDDDQNSGSDVVINNRTDGASYNTTDLRPRHKINSVLIFSLSTRWFHSSAFICTLQFLIRDAKKYLGRFQQAHWFPPLNDANCFTEWLVLDLNSVSLASIPFLLWWWCRLSCVICWWDARLKFYATRLFNPMLCVSFYDAAYFLSGRKPTPTFKRPDRHFILVMRHYWLLVCLHKSLEKTYSDLSCLFSLSYQKK